MIEIEIIDTNKRLPLSKTERLRMTFQASDFGDAGSGAGSFSTTCTVPITPKVIEALGFAIVPNATALLTAYKNIKARILQDENEIDKGFIRIDEANSTKKELKIIFYGRNVDWFTAMGDKTLKEVDLSQYDHYKTTQAINEERTEGYVYLPVDYGTLKTKSTATITESEIWPSVFVKAIVQQMFKDLGFKVAGSIFNKPEFNRLLIPFSLEEVNITYLQQANLTFYGEKGNSLVIGEEITLPSYDPNLQIPLVIDKKYPYRGPASYGGEITKSYEWEILYSALRDDLDTYNTSTNIYTAPATMTASVLVSVAGIIMYLGGSSGQRDTFEIDVVVKKNGTEFGRDRVKIYGSGAPVYVRFENEHVASFTIPLVQGDELDFFIEIKTAYTSGLYGSGYVDDFSPAIRITPFLSDVEAFKYSLGTFLPNMPQSDLMEYLFFLYGIIPSFDKATNTVYLDSLSDLTVENAEDWSGKLDTSQTIERNYFDFVSDYAKKNLCKYTELEEDTETNAYKNTYLEIYGSGNFEIDNDYLDAEQDYFEAKFFSTKQRKVFTGVSGSLNFQLPYIFKTDSEEGRVLLFAGFRSVSELSNAGISTVSIAGTSRSTIPYSYFIPPVNINIDDPINLYHLGIGQPKDEFQNSLSILQRTYYNLQKVLNKPISITANLKLTAYDISRLKFNRLKYIQELGGYFYLNKVNQYDGSGDSTECELIKWY